MKTKQMIKTILFTNKANITATVFHHAITFMNITFSAVTELKNYWSSNNICISNTELKQI